MPMKNPPHPGEMVGDALDELGVTVSDAARGLGVTRQQLHNVLSGRCAISPEMAFRLEKALGGGAEMWLRMQTAHDLAQVRARAGEIQVERLTPKVA